MATLIEILAIIGGVLGGLYGILEGEIITAILCIVSALFLYSYGMIIELLKDIRYYQEMTFNNGIKEEK